MPIPAGVTPADIVLEEGAGDHSVHVRIGGATYAAALPPAALLAGLAGRASGGTLTVTVPRASPPVGSGRRSVPVF